MTLTLLGATTITGLIAFAGQKFPRLAIGASTWYTLIYFSEPLRHRFVYTFAFLLSLILGGVFGFHLYPTHKRVGHFFIGTVAPLGLVDAISAAAFDRMSLLLNQLNIKAPLEPAEMATVLGIAFGLAIGNGWLTFQTLFCAFIHLDGVCWLVCHGHVCFQHHCLVLPRV
ncbi:hypothetical protein LEN26_018533 [Aphanomyces euteiches]|nr:hypothetical protein LEN26_018533 [Aphanomyces euteiches]KAH9128156.1 hypothetical protein AeMF1_001632 [Aphanomyces euteiches]KAH9190254.1 hypothetical protein AeNC1_007777 [Aphanomyces euteiches]